MLICDTHADTLWAMASGRTEGLDITREMLTARKDDTRVQALALFIPPHGMEQSPTALEKELLAAERLLAQGWYQVTRVEDARMGEANFLLTIEGGEAFGDDADNVNRLSSRGVRIASLTWNSPNLLAQSSELGNDTGLTDFGRVVVSRMRQCHMAVDVSHLNQLGFWDLLEMGAMPMASHSCARTLCDITRNLTDDQLRALFEIRSYVGVNFYSAFLSASGQANLDTLIDHIAYMCDLGGEDCVGLGSDFDGIDAWPDGLRNTGDLPALFDRMRQRGFDEELVEKIAGLNFKRYLSLI